jgi:hypothetical protein
MLLLVIHTAAVGLHLALYVRSLHAQRLNVHVAEVADGPLVDGRVLVIPKKISNFFTYRRYMSSCCSLAGHRLGGAVVNGHGVTGQAILLFGLSALMWNSAASSQNAFATATVVAKRREPME